MVELYMKRALELAALGREWVSPNPMVGCVIVYNNTIIGEGFHQKFGGSHAEVNALAQVKDPSLLPEATVYVSLEPCSHYGKTPPCTQALIKAGVKKVVICNTDPNPLVSGKGISLLQENGIDVINDVLANDGEELNRRFFKAQRTNMPYVILKWAETADGYISKINHQPIKISNKATDIKVHQWRAEEDAILVGKNTAISDNPRLNVRLWTTEKQPTRIVLDSSLEISRNKNVFDNSQKTFIFNQQQEATEGETQFIKTTGLENTLQLLKQKGINSILVEGGRQVLESFIKEGLFDEIRLIKNTSIVLGEGIPAPSIPAGTILSKKEDVLDDMIFFYRRFQPFTGIHSLEE